MKSEIIEHAKKLEKKYEDKQIDYKQIIDAYELVKAKGFPYYGGDVQWRNEQFQKMLEFKRDAMLDRKHKVIGQSTHGLNLAGSYMKHMWDIKCGKMRTPVEKLQEYFVELMAFSDKSTQSSEDQVLLAGAMMGAAKMLYQNNLSEQEFNDIMDHNGKDLINLIKPTIH